MENFRHEHPLNLVDMQPDYPQYEEDYEEGDDLNTKQDFRCPCDRCGQDIIWFHRYYYKCSYSCDYSIHKFCVELPTTLKHISHNDHALILLKRKTRWTCNICRRDHKPKELSYCCSLCDFDIDVNCAVKENQVIHHPSHPHPLVPGTSKPVLCECDACGKEHKGVFYHCTTCSAFSIHNDCAFLSKKLLVCAIGFSHIHPLTLSYSFPKEDQKAKFNPSCRICDGLFKDELLWIYKCEKCRYYAHVNCATSRGGLDKETLRKRKLFLDQGRKKRSKTFSDARYLGLLHLPFLDQTYNIQHLVSQEIGYETFKTNDRNLKHMSHEHTLILVHAQHNDITRSTSSKNNSLSCHNPMKKIELLCNGCVRPIITMPFYKCNNEDQHCDFVFHEWCTRLPTQVKNHPSHPKHTLVLLPKIPCKFFGVYYYDVCRLPCNGFVYSCVQCDYHVDVSCGFIPEKITHEAHPGHILYRLKSLMDGRTYCHACLDCFDEFEVSFACIDICNFVLHPTCALLLPQTIRHRYDKHPMKLSYLPIENHKSEYFCEICEEEFNPSIWFYHCYECAQSIHSACAPVILGCDTTSYSLNHRNIYDFLNVKFGGTYDTEGHPHPLSFVQGIASDGQCTKCGIILQNKMIFKCQKCKFAVDMECCKHMSN